MTYSFSGLVKLRSISHWQGVGVCLCVTAVEMVKRSVTSEKEETKKPHIFSFTEAKVKHE